MSLHWIERYRIPNEAHEGWAVVHIDSKGFLGVVSDYGDYAFHWTHFGEDFKQFLVGLDWSYLHGKLTLGRSRVYDGQATVKAIKDHIREYRRTQALGKEAARTEWDLIVEHESDVEDGELGFSRWYDETNLSDAAEFSHTMEEPQCKAFCQKVWPRFIEKLKAGDHEPIEPSGDLAGYRESTLKALEADWNDGHIDATALLEQAFDRAIAFMRGNPRPLPDPSV